MTINKLARRRIVLIIFCVFACAGQSWVFAHEEEHEPPGEVQATRLTDGKTFGNNPAMAVAANGDVWVTWIRHHADKGDEVVVADGGGSRLDVLTDSLGQYLRPVLAAAEDQLHCVWTQTEHDRVSSIWHTVRTDGKWTRASRLAPDESRAHQNPEIAAGPDGRFAVVYQVHNGSEYEIHLMIDNSTLLVSPPGTNDWDPTVVFDADGELHVAWSGFKDGDYDIYWRRGDAAPQRISSRGQYDLHPWLSAAADGSVWVAWDAVELPGHATSGSTTIIGANPGHKIPSMYGAGQKSWIEVRTLVGDTMRLPGSPKQEILPPEGYETSHSALPKVVIGQRGQPWIVYRALHRQRGSWLAQGGSLYYWDLVARPFRDGQWAEPVRMGFSDGYLEEASVASGTTGIHVAYGGEQRIGSPERMKKSRQPPPEPDPHNHHTDFMGRVGCNGEVFLAKLDDAVNKPLELHDAPKLADRAMPSCARTDPYVVETGGRKFRLYWGDTHRHSNVSRCSVGLEPTPDDLYRYGDDICNYDFFALSDHGEHFQNTTADSSHYYWWLNLKLADLYHVPEYMSVLYNYEWTMNFPHGHRNVIFPGRPTLRMDKVMAESNTLSKGWTTLSDAGMRAITIPHTGADPEQGTAWEVQDDRYQRVVEIFQSARGSYEHDGCPRQFHNSGNKKGFYWKGLEKGYHMGVIASSDHGYGVAYACVYAEQNSREAIWQALWDRRCYGSTTYGLVVDLRSGDHWMGERWTANEAPVLNVYTEGPVPIRSVEIIGRSQVLHAEGSVDSPLREMNHRLQWSDPEWSEQTDEQWYYVRVILTNDEIAWSSPVWVTPGKPNESSR